MTTAVCFRCGAIKFGAFVPCPKCSAAPQTEDDLALSLAMTDHYFGMPTLEQMGAAVRDGEPPHLDPETRAELIGVIRDSGLLDKFHELSRDRNQESRPGTARPTPPRPWWKFW